MGLACTGAKGHNASPAYTSKIHTDKLSSTANSRPILKTQYLHSLFFPSTILSSLSLPSSSTLLPLFSLISHTRPPMHNTITLSHSRRSSLFFHTPDTLNFPSAPHFFLLHLTFSLISYPYHFSIFPHLSSPSLLFLFFETGIGYGRV